MKNTATNICSRGSGGNKSTRSIIVKDKSKQMGVSRTLTVSKTEDISGRVRARR